MGKDMDKVMETVMATVVEPMETVEIAKKTIVETVDNSHGNSRVKKMETVETLMETVETYNRYSGK